MKSHWVSIADLVISTERSDEKSHQSKQCILSSLRELGNVISPLVEMTEEHNQKKPYYSK